MVKKDRKNCLQEGVVTKKCLQRCIGAKKRFAPKDFSSPTPPSRKIMVRPLHVSFATVKAAGIFQILNNSGTLDQ